MQVAKQAEVARIMDKAFKEIDSDGTMTITYQELLAAFRSRPELLSEYFGQNILGQYGADISKSDEPEVFC